MLATAGWRTVTQSQSSQRSQAVDWRIAAAIALGAAALRLFFAIQPLDRIDRVFIPDDTYYTLAVARSLAHGLGPSADRATLTNGFQPLLAFLMVPVYWGTADPDLAVHVVVALAAVADALAVFFIFRVAARAWGRAAGSAAAVLWAVSPYAIANALGGLEASLAILSVLLVVDTAAPFFDCPSMGRAAAIGFLAGLAWLARVDTVAVAVLVTVSALLRAKPRLAHYAIAASAFLVAVGPWWTYELARFGTIVPESGAAVRTQVALHQILYLTTFKQAAWAAGYLTSAPFVDLRAWRLWLFLNDRSGLLVFVLAWTAAALLLGRAAVRRGRLDAPHILIAFGLIVSVFYTFYVPAVWFFRRYLAPAELGMTFGWAVAVGLLWDRRTFAARAAASLVIVFACAEATVQGIRWARMEASALDIGFEGPKGYREPARLIIQLLPSNAVVGAFQSGALAYYAPPSIQIVNLDGVVDRTAHRATVEGRLRDYGRERGIGWFADWPFNHNAWRVFSERASSPDPVFREIWRGPLRGPDRTILWAVEWPNR